MSDAKDTSLGRRPTSPQLPAGEPEDQVIAILDRPDALEFVASIDPPTVYRLISDAGWELAQELVPLLTSEQLQTCVDLDCWTSHEFRPAKFSPWLAALVSASSDAVFRRGCREMDPEILALYFSEYVLVDFWGEEGEVPDAFWDKEPVERSPDGVYALVYEGDDSTNALMRAAVARLYDVDRVLAWTLFEATRWELQSGMQEEALRWRTSRLEEWGFVDFDEALQIYRPLDGARFRDKLERGDYVPKVGVEPQTNMPAMLNITDGARYYAARIMRALVGQDLERALAEFVALQNRATVGEGIDPGDRADAERVAERTTGYLSIGLEFLARQDDERALEILRTVPLRDVFRVGYTTVEKLRENVQRVRRRPTLSLVEGVRFSLLREADTALAESVANIRPVFADEAGYRDIFHTQAQVDDAAARLAMIAFKQLWLFGVQRSEPPDLVQRAQAGAWLNEAPELTFDAFFATAVAQVLLGRPPDTLGLEAAALDDLGVALRARSWVDDPIAAFEPLVGPVFEALGGAGRLMTRWLDATIAELVDELGAVASPDPAMFTALLIMKRDA